MIPPNPQNFKFVPVDASLLQSVCYVPAARLLVVKFNNQQPALSFENVPGFRYDGLMAAPRKDAYYKTFIEHHFLASPFKLT